MAVRSVLYAFVVATYPLVVVALPLGISMGLGDMVGCIVVLELLE